MKQSQDNFLKIHRRQFFISRFGIPIDGWCHHDLENKFILSVCPELSVQHVRTSERQSVWLLGDPVQGDPHQPEPSEALRLRPWADVVSVTYSWAGRWALLSDSTILVDAGGLMPVFFVDGKAGEPTGSMISSSLALLSKQNARLSAYERNIRWGRGIDWYPPPLSRLKGVRKLLPSQRLNLDSLEVSFLNRFRLDAFVERTFEEKIDLLTSSYTHILRQLHEKGTKTIVFLTGGLDSRTTLSAAIAANIPFECVTIKRLAPKYDFEIPKKLCQSLGILHKNMEQRVSRRDFVDQFDQHCFRSCVEFERHAISRGQLHVDKDFRSVILRSGCWELSRAFYHEKLGLSSWSPRTVTSKSILRKWRMSCHDQDLDDGIQEWLIWQETLSYNNIDWRDLFYLDQRMCGWLSATEQALDILPYTFFQPANCQRIFDVLLSIEPHRRTNGDVQIQMIKQQTPQLLEFPINGSSDLLYSLKFGIEKMSKAVWEIQHRVRSYGNIGGIH